MKNKIQYKFSGPLWKHNSDGGWHFVSLPKEISAEIREHLQWQEEGWGRMKAHAEIANHPWETAIWFDTKHDTYILPVKADVRNKNGFKVDDVLEVKIYL